MHSDLIIDKTFGPYTLEKVIGDSDFSQTFIAWRTADLEKKPLALRRFRRKISSDEQFVRYFRFLTKVLSLLSHQAIPPLSDSGILNELCFMTRSYIKGFSLADMIDHSLRGNVDLGPPIIQAVLSQLLDVLDYSNNVVITDKKKGVTHSNLSPANIIIDETGQLHLVDYRPPFTRPDLLRQFNIMPFARMSPEMALNKSVNEQSDIFQTGLLLYEMVYYETFFKNIDSFNTLKAELERKIPLKNEPRAEMPEKINAIIVKIINVLDDGNIASFQHLTSFLQHEWHLLTIAESKEMLKDYAHRILNDQVHDIIEDFKEEIEETLEEISFEDPLVEVSPETISAPQDTTQTHSPLTVPTCPLDYETIGIMSYVTLLQNIKETLTIKPNNQELIKSAYDILQKMELRYKIYCHFIEAELDRKSGQVIEEIIHYLFIIGLEKENKKALEMLHRFAGTATGTNDTEAQAMEQLLTSGLELFRDQKFHEAITLLDKVPRSSSVYRQAKELKDKAVQLMDQQVDREFSFQQGMNFLEDGKNVLAIQELTKVLCGDPNNITAIEAIARAQKNLLEEQETINQLFEDAALYMNEKNYERAIEKWQSILEIDSDNQKAHDYIFETQQTIEKREASIEALIDKANTFIEVERFDKAIEQWEQILALNPELVEIKDKIEQAKSLIDRADQPEAPPSPSVEHEIPAGLPTLQVVTQTEDDTNLQLELEDKTDVSGFEAEAAVESIEPEMESESGEAEREVDAQGLHLAMELIEPDSHNGIQHVNDPFQADPPTSDGEAQVRLLLEEGLQHYGNGDYWKSIEVWTRVLDIDPHHEQALEYIELAREEARLQAPELSEQGSGPGVIDELQAIEGPMPQLQTLKTEQNDLQKLDLSEHELQPIEELTELTDDTILEPEHEVTPKEQDLELADENNAKEISDDDLPELELDNEQSLEMENDYVLDTETEEASEQLPLVSLRSDIIVEDPVIDEHDAKTGDSVAILDEASIVEEIKPAETAPRRPVPKKAERPSFSEEDIEDIFQRGFQAFENEQFDVAVSEWTKALSLNPHHTKTRILLEKAKSKLAEARTKKKPAQVPREKRSQMIIAGSIGAILLIAIVVGSYFGWSAYSTSSNKKKAFLNYDNHNYSKAIQYFSEYLKKEPGDVIAVEKLGESYLQEKKFKPAILTLKKISDPSILVLQNLGEAYYHSDNPELAKQQFEAIRNKDQNNVKAIIGSAKSYFKLGDPQQTIRDYQLALKLDQSLFYDEDWDLMGQAFSKIGDYQSALEYYQKIQNHSPQSVMGIGQIYFDMGDFTEAQRWFRKAKELDAKSVENRLKLGQCFYRLKQYQEAIDEYLGLLELFPNELDVYIELGTAYLKLERYEDAISSYKKALEVYPDNAKLNFNLGVTYHAQNNLEAAAAEYLKAIEANPDYAEALANLGSIYYSQKNIETAKETWLKSLKINPDQPQIQILLGRIFR